MILNKCIRFISLAETRYISCIHYQFWNFKKHLACFAAPLTVQDTSKLTDNERNTGRCTHNAVGKAKMVNGI